MKKRFISGMLCLLLLAALWAPVSAAEEVSGEPEPIAAQTPVPVEAGMEETAAEEPELPETEEEIAVVETEEIAALETEESTAEEPVPDTDLGSELPIAELPETLIVDPEDPMTERAMRQRMDGAYGSTWSAFTTRSLNNETLRKGIDVSAWQETINWTKVKNAGVEFVFIRAAYRGASTGKLNKDGRFVDYINGAKAAGLKVGVYIFSQAITVKEAQEEADYLMSLVSGYTIDLPLVFDLEHYSGGRFTNAKLSRRAVTDMCLAFCQRVESKGYDSMVYSNPSMLNNEMYASEIGRLWLANYITKTGYTGHKYEYWQCSDHGTVNGISGNVDLDFWFQPKSVQSTPAPTPTPTPVPTPDPAAGPFTDVKKSDWFYDAVMDAYEAGVVKGMSSTTFAPGGTTTRGQLVTMLHRMAKEPAATQETSFTDLTQEYYRAAVCWAAEQGIVKGYSETTFRPDRPITREELVTILYRMAGEPETTGDISSYADAEEVHSWAADAMAWSVKNGLVTGYEDDTLRPRLEANRAVVCTILMRLGDLAA